MSFAIQNDTNSIQQLARASSAVGGAKVSVLGATSVPDSPLIGAPFTYRDIANQVIAYRQSLMDNPVMQQYLDNPLTDNSAFLLSSNRVLVNLSRNFCNNPANPPPSGYIMRATIMASDGEVIVDVVTYTDQFNYDRNIIYMNSWYNLINTPNPPNYPIDAINTSIPSTLPFMNADLLFNGNMVNPATIATTSKGMELSEQHVIVQSARTFTYPANTANPPPSMGNAVSYSVYPNIGGRKEMVQATVQGWGWASRHSSVYAQKPGYYVANYNEGKDGYSLVLRIAYMKIA